LFVRRAYQYRLYPAPTLETALVWRLDCCREPYIAALNILSRAGLAGRVA